MTLRETPLPEDIAELILAYIENTRRVDAIDMRLFEGTGEAPQEWIERGHLSGRMRDALEARSSELGPVIVRLLGEAPDAEAARVLRLLQRTCGV